MSFGQTRPVIGFDLASDVDALDFEAVLVDFVSEGVFSIFTFWRLL